MDAAIDVASLEEAVTVFYRSNAQQQSAAHQWLIKAQQSQQAWSFVWDLMQLNKVSASLRPILPKLLRFYNSSEIFMHLAI